MVKILSLSVFLSLVFCLSAQVIAQEDSIPVTKNSTEEFLRAKDLAFSGKRKEARIICNQILDREPEYYDAGILIGRTFAWDKNFDDARKELKKVLDADFDNKDAIFAIIDTEKWADSPSKALFYCDYGQSFYPSEEKFLLQKIELLYETGEESKSLQSLNELLELNPGSEEGLILLRKYKSSKMKYQLIYQHDFEYFKEPYSRRWHISSFQLARRNNWGSLIGKINLGDLVFDGESFWSNEVAKQFELDAYPRVSKMSYAYLSYGYSPDNLFPKHRAGAELYHKLPASFEISGGLRFLRFDGNSEAENVYIYTGSIGKYYRNYWFSFRTYLTPKNSDVSQSYWFIIRRYIRDSQNYFGVELGTGVSPDEPRGNGSSLDTYKYDSKKIKLSYQDQIFVKRLTYLLRVGYEREEYEVNEKRNVITLSVKLSYQL